MMFLWGGNGCGTVYIGKISLKLKPVYKLPLIWPFVKIVVTEIPKRGGVSEAVFWLAIADCLISFVGTRVRHRTIYLDYRISIIQLFGKALRVFHNRDSSGLLIAYKCLLWCYFSGLSWVEISHLLARLMCFVDAPDLLHSFTFQLWQDARWGLYHCFTTELTYTLVLNNVCVLLKVLCRWWEG